MKQLLGFIVILPFFAVGDPDTMITRKTHTDGFVLGEREVPARDATQTIWMRGKDKFRFEEGDRVTIVRLDEKKIHLLNTKDKTVTSVDYPFDFKKYIPEDSPFADQLDRMPQQTVAVKATEETKKVKEWNATKYTVTRSGGFGGGAGRTEDVWASKDVKVDAAAFHQMYTATQSLAMGMGGNAGNDELKKIEGVPVLIESSRMMGEEKVVSRQEIVSVESKEGAATLFDIPADYEKKPFDMRTAMGGGGMGRGGRRGGDGGAASQPGGNGNNGGRGGRRAGGRGGESRPASGPAEKPTEK